MRLRNEIRSLSIQEWDDVVNAIWIMKNTSLQDGILLYGSKFVTYDRMLAKHAHAALNPDGDQAHFGPIFAVFHRAWLLEFENCLLAINPKISGLPYWDCTIDARILSNGHIEGVNESIFSDRYLGSSVGAKTSGYAVKSGRFAFWPIAMSSALYNLSSNIFGFMRHPLSLNDTPYLSRHGGYLCGSNLTLPTSKDWNYCLTSTKPFDIVSWDACVEPYIHAPPHTYLAGSWFTVAQQKAVLKNASETHFLNTPNCVQWLGYISPPSWINTSRIPPRTYIHPYAANCFTCPKSKQPCFPKNPMNLCGPLFSGFIDYIKAHQNPRRLTAQTTSDDDYYYYEYDFSDFQINPSMEPTTVERHFEVTLVDSKLIQVLGDFGDPAFSPNDPMFPFHHANVDRHLSTWLLSKKKNTTLSELNYLQFPVSGYAKGCNLNDIVNERDPFKNIIVEDGDDFKYEATIPIDDEWLNDHPGSYSPTKTPTASCRERSFSAVQAYTVKEIMDYTFALNYDDQLYTYDTIKGNP